MSRYTHGHHESVLRSHRWRTATNSAAHLLPHLDGSEHLLDLGACAGTITADLARLVNTVVATEIGESELEWSRATAVERGAANVEFVVADCHDLPFPDDTFDVAHAHQVLQHVADPVQALRELRRVTKPGGLVAVRDSDYAGFIWWPLLPELDRWLDLYRRAARANGGEPDAGRRLLGWAREAGFDDITPSSSTWCLATPEDRAWWGGMWADRVIESALATQLLGDHLATRAVLGEIREAWLTWADDEAGWISIVHGEVLCRV